MPSIEILKTPAAQANVHLKEIMDKLHKAPLSITTEDARRLSENFVAVDDRSAKIISAVETLAIAAQDVHNTVPVLGQAPQTSLLTIVNDLKAVVDNSPQQVTVEIVKITQGIVSKMQRAIAQNNAPHPELESELQEEYARIEPKVEQGIVTQAEADRLHSLEARAHGHTEKGGLAAVAQSVAAKRERALSLSDNQAELEAEQAKIEPKVEKGAVAKAEADRLHSLETRAHGRTEKGGLTAVAQSVVAKRERDNQAELETEQAKIEPKVEKGAVTKADADRLHSLETRVHGHTEKGGLTATAQSIAARRERSLNLSDNTNKSPSTTAKGLTAEDSAAMDKDVNVKLAELAIGDKVETEN